MIKFKTNVMLDYCCDKCKKIPDKIIQVSNDSYIMKYAACGNHLEDIIKKIQGSSWFNNDVKINVEPVLLDNSYQCVSCQNYAGKCRFMNKEFQADEIYYCRECSKYEEKSLIIKEPEINNSQKNLSIV